jgi:ABC-type iron transport system FetAB ATPase subunit
VRPATFDRLGLGHLSLDRQVGEVSGGEAVLLALAAQFLRRPDVLLLDEPTNNLDLDARGRLRDAVHAWPGSCSWSATTEPCWTWSTRSPTCATAGCAGTAGT